MAHITELSIGLIEYGPDTQARLATTDAAIDEYAEILQNGGELPPITVFFDGDDYWTADGFHRIEAHKAAGHETIFAEVRDGSKDEAILFACAANAEHGVQRSAGDKRRAVQLVMANPIARKWSDAKIAAHCKVSRWLVSELRTGMGAEETVREGLDGRTIDVRKINKEGATEARLARARKSRTGQDSEPDEESSPASQDAAEMQLEMLCSPYRRAGNDLTRIKSDMNAMAGDPNLGGHLLNKITRIAMECDSLRGTILQSMPGAWCEDCNHQGCKKCANMGWITTQQVNQKKRAK